MLTRQEIFNRVKNHLLTQNERAYDSSLDAEHDTTNNGCYYRAPNGCKCAIGGIIPDNLYNPEWEGKGIAYIIDNIGAKAVFGEELADNVYECFLSELQSIHDNNDVSEWPDILNAFAEQYELHP